MKDQTRNINPHKEAVFAMYHWHNEYARLGLGCMDYYDELPQRAKKYCSDAINAMLKARPKGARER